MAIPSAMAVLAVASAVLLGAVGLPLWQPLLVAAVIAGSLSSIRDRVAGAVGGRRTLSSALITIGVVLVVLVPLSLVVLLVVKEALGLVAFVRHTLEEQGLAGLLAPLPDWLERWADDALESLSQGPHDLRTVLAKWSHTGRALGVAAGLLGSVTHLLLMLGLMLVALFFLLRDGPALIGWAEKSLPIPAGQLRALLSELGRVSKSVIGAHLATGFIQAAVATLGYAVSGVPSPILFGVLTLTASFIPSLGTAVIGLPLAGLLWLMNHHAWAIFLLAWTTLVTGLVDNVVRPLLVRGGTDLHGALIFFALLGGILAFGPMGIIVGPLALALFLSVTTIRRRERGGLIGQQP
jgi:predicted PurR-regulated permease PerM